MLVSSVTRWRSVYSMQRKVANMENKTEPKTAGQWLRYIGMALIAIWLIVFLLRMSGINVI